MGTLNCLVVEWLLDTITSALNNFNPRTDLSGGASQFFLLRSWPVLHQYSCWLALWSSQSSTELLRNWFWNPVKPNKNFWEMGSARWS